MSCKHGNWERDCDECAEELAFILKIQELEAQRDALRATLQSIATSFVAKTAPEQALMEEAAAAVARCTPQPPAPPTNPL